MADNNKVTIDAAWFAELYAKAEQFELEHSACHLNGAAIALKKERDELKAKMTRIVETNEHTSRSLHDQCCKLKGELAYRKDELDRAYDELKSVKEDLAKITKDCVQYERISESLQAANKIIEDERADKLKVIKELNEVRELNRKCCDENETLKAKLDCADVDCETYKDRAEAAERCIEEMWSKMQTFDIPDRQRLIEIEEIIRAYREKKEEK